MVVRQGKPGLIKACQVAHPIVGRRGHHPRVTAVAKEMCKAVVVLKNKRRLGRERRADRVPVDRVRQIDIEVGHHRPPLLLEVGRRRKIRLLHVLHLTDECLLRRATAAGIPLDCALVDHDREGEAGMGLGFGHNEFCGLVDAVVRPVPVNDHAINTTTDHVRDLTVNLRRVGRVVADIHVVRRAEPQEQVSIDFGIRARVEQGVNVNLTDIGGAGITVGLVDETIGGAGVVRRLRSQRGGRNDKVIGREHTSRGQQQNCSTQTLSTHLSSGAEGPRSFDFTEF